MKVYIITNILTKKVFSSKHKAKMWLAEHKYRLKNGFYTQYNEINSEFDLIIDEQEVL